MKEFQTVSIRLEDYRMNNTKTFYEQLGGTYTQVGDYLVPDLLIGQSELQPIGKYGRMRKRYLKEHRPVLFTNMLVREMLFEHLAEIDRSCEDRIDLITRQMAKREGVTEALKATDQMAWVQSMNSIKNRAEEIVLSELVYC